MSISSAMYAAVTGLSALSTGMQVISNNIANVNTTGFKAARTNFEDLISQDYWSNGKTNQIGRGVKVASIQQMFTQGSFINSAQDTDMAIAGEGFFMVRDRVTNTYMYTRAGNFTFDANGYLETPAGYVLQGWELSVPKPGADPVKIGVPVDVKVVALNAPPLATTQIKVVANLNSEDVSAYVYSSAELVELYAEQQATGPANSARIAAEKAVYDYSSHGSAYVNLSSAFNRAYVSYMSAQGYVLSGGVFEKTVVTNPSTLQKAEAAASASAAAWAALGISASTYPYPVSAANSILYQNAYNSAYVKYMTETLKYTHISADGFQKISSTPAGTTLTGAANQTALAAARVLNASYSTYPSGVPAEDQAYETAYVSYMSGQGYSRPPDTYRTNPTGAAITSAEISAANYGGDQAGTDLEQLWHAAGYAKEMARQGYSLDSSYAVPALPTGYSSSPTTTAAAAAVAAGEAAAGGTFASLATEADKL
jgi:flagellar hook-basal body protein